ncbi:MAG: phytoene desaturase family protein [Omnitrophica WOR_2 bacterium]
MTLSGGYSDKSLDAVIVGAGPNGLAAAITLARSGQSVLLIEARDTVGGGVRSGQLTLPGFIHDICSAVHPLGVASPFFRSVPLSEYGLSWVYPDASLVHPLDDGTAVVLERSVQETAANLGTDGGAYQRIMDPVVKNWQKLQEDLLGPLRIPPHYPLLMARFGLSAIQPAYYFAKSHFKGSRARAVFAGLSAHSQLPLQEILTTGYALMFGTMAHAVGWPVARRGSQAISDALAAYFKSLGGEIRTGWEVKDIGELPASRSVLFDVTPRQLLKIAGGRLPEGYKRRLARFRYGPGVFKVDYALSDAIPWKAAECRRSITVHIGGTLDEIAVAEAAVGKGEHPERPFVLLSQPSLFDPTRAPNGQQTVWAYCHVPNGSTVDMTARIEAQIERFAPGFKDCILARSVKYPMGMEEYNPNYIGGDINGGVQDMWQFFTRPVVSLDPYATPAKGIYLCSSSTPPGGGVHGMCGYYASQSVLRRK